MLYRVLAIIVIGLLLVATSTSVLGFEKSSDGINVVNAGNYIIFESKKLVLLLRKDIPLIRLWLRGKNYSTTYLIKFHNIFEFVDSNGNGRFDLGERIYSLAPFATSRQNMLANWILRVKKINYGNYSEHRIIYFGKIQVMSFGPNMPRIPRGYVNMTIIIHLYSKDIFFEGRRILSGLEAKLDIKIGKYPWSLKSSKIGLSIIFAAEGIKIGKIYEEKKVFMVNKREFRKFVWVGEDSDYGFYFSYINSAIADGKEIDVNHTIYRVGDFRKNFNAEETGFRWLVLTYGQYENEIIHDPIIGLKLPSADLLFTKSELLIMLLSTLFILGVSIIVTKSLYRVKRI